MAETAGRRHHVSSSYDLCVRILASSPVSLSPELVLEMHSRRLAATLQRWRCCMRAILSPRLSSRHRWSKFPFSIKRQHTALHPALPPPAREDLTHGTELHGVATRVTLVQDGPTNRSCSCVLKTPMLHFGPCVVLLPLGFA